MSAKGQFRKGLFYLMFAVASMLGNPIRAEEIERLLRSGQETKIVHTIDGGNDPPELGHGGTEVTEPE